MADAPRSEAELGEQTVDELREQAKEADVSGRSDMRKDELVEALASSGSGAGSDGDLGAGPDGGGMRTGPQSSDSLKYSQEVTSPDEEPERDGRSLVTTHHQLIQEWAQARGGTPATVEGTGPDGSLGVLRILFDGRKADGNLREVTWDEWFATFDERGLDFIYQETTSDGSQSTFFRLENPNREDG